MLFSEEFISNLNNDPINGALEVCNKTMEQIDVNPHSEWSETDFQYLIEAYSIIIELIDLKLLAISVMPISLSGGIGQMCINLHEYISSVRNKCTENSAQLKISALRNKVRQSIGNGFFYEFSQGDLDIVQANINELRSLISNSDHFEPEHQQRLLKRLEKLQSELHKKISDLDKFWGLIGDAGVVLSKLGTDAKPFVDRIKDIADVVWRTQSRAEELPSGTKLPSFSSDSIEKDV